MFAVQLNDEALFIVLALVGVLLTPALAVLFLVVLRRRE